MSKIWVNGAEIDLAKLTPEEIYALMHSENLDYIKPDGMYYSASISGDGSLDAPYGVASLPNPLTISVITEQGVEERVYDGSAPTEIQIEDYKSVVDNNTLTGTGSQASPFRVSNDLLRAIDSAYTTSIQTATLIDGLEDTIESVIEFQDEVSAKCNEAIFIANSAVSVAYDAKEIALLAELLANSAVTEVEKNSEDIDKLYDFIATLIYNITYNDKTDDLEITYVDGSTSKVHISNIAKLEAEFSDLSAYTAYLKGEIDQFSLDLKKVVVDLTYRPEDYTLIVHFFDGSTKELTIEEFEKIKETLELIADTLANQESAITEINYNISSITEVLNVYSGDITNIYNTIDVIDQYITNVYQIASGNSVDLSAITSVLTPIAEQFPDAVKDIDIVTTTDGDGNISSVLNYTTFSGNTVEVPMTGIDNAINDLKNQMLSCVTDITYSNVDEILKVYFNNGTVKRYGIKPKEYSGKTIPIYFKLADGVTHEFVDINGDVREILPDGEPVTVTGTSIELNIDEHAGITEIDFNGEMLDSNSTINNLQNLKVVKNAILPSNGSEMFANDIKLEVVNVNSDLLINGENMFSECSALTTFDSNLKTLIIAPFMFYDCCSLVDFQTDMPMLQEANYMFYNCESIVTLNNLNLKRLEDGTAMFADCDLLKEVNNIKLDKLTNGSMMFSGSTHLDTNSIECPSLITGDSMFCKTSFAEYRDCNLSNLKYSQYMFAYNTSLTKFIVPNLNNVEIANGMFIGCNTLETVDVDYAFENLIEGNNMFAGCSQLQEVSTKWTLDDLQTANGMFSGCSSIHSFDIDMLKLREGNNMFADCSNLTGVTADVRSLTVAENMFKGCTKLEKAELKSLGCSVDLSETNINNTMAKKLSEFVISYKGTSKENQVTITFSGSQNISTATQTAFSDKGWKVVIL